MSRRVASVVGESDGRGRSGVIDSGGDWVVAMGGAGRSSMADDSGSGVTGGDMGGGLRFVVVPMLAVPTLRCISCR